MPNQLGTQCRKNSQETIASSLFSPISLQGRTLAVFSNSRTRPLKGRLRRRGDLREGPGEKRPRPPRQRLREAKAAAKAPALRRRWAVITAWGAGEGEWGRGALRPNRGEAGAASKPPRPGPPSARAPRPDATTAMSCPRQWLRHAIPGGFSNSLRRLRRRLPQNTRIEFQSLSGFRMPCKWMSSTFIEGYTLVFQSLSGFRMPCKMLMFGAAGESIKFQSLSGFRMPCKRGG